MCGARWTTYEEKQTDVAIAVSLVEDAARATFDTALVVSADSDLCPAVRAVRRLHPAGRVVIAFPPARRSDDLRASADAAFTISKRKLAASLMLDRFEGPDGTIFDRPSCWT